MLENMVKIVIEIVLIWHHMKLNYQILTQIMMKIMAITSKM